MLLNIKNINNIPGTFKLTIHRPSNRGKLLKWLYHVATRLGLTPDVFILGIHIADMHNNKKYDAYGRHQQIIGVTALFMASKHKGMSTANVCEYASITNGMCTADDILRMEKEMMYCTDGLEQEKDHYVNVGTLRMLERADSIDWEAFCRN